MYDLVSRLFVKIILFLLGYLYKQTANTQQDCQACRQSMIVIIAKVLFLIAEMLVCTSEMLPSSSSLLLR